MQMITIPDMEDFDDSPDRYDERMVNWTSPEAERFGTWYDWSEDDVDYLLTELAGGHWDDCGDKCYGFAMAEAGCMIAKLANMRQNNNELRNVLDAFAMGLHWMLDEIDGLNEPAVIATAEAVLKLLADGRTPEDFIALRTMAMRRSSASGSSADH
jgi:hypothetical protein